MSIKLVKAVIDVFTVQPGTETVIIRGVLDCESLPLIKSGPYQREVVPGASAKQLKAALRTSTVPDVELGMRGEKYRVHEGKTKDEGDTFYLQDDVYVIDGLQRISAAKALIAEDSSALPRLGAVIHLPTTEEWEAERFRILNQERLKINPNILLRNGCSKSEALDMIYRLCEDETFVLCRRVQWSQRMARNELVTAVVLTQVVGYLHSRFGPGRGNYNIRDTGPTLDKTMKAVGRTTMRDNIKTFFEILDECYGVRRVVYHHGATFIRRNFMTALADIFTRHTNFWRGQRLFVEKDLRMKIAKFNVNDAEIARLAGAGGAARDILYEILLRHINSGKRTRRLEPVDGMEPKGDEAPEEQLEGELVAAK